MENKIIYKEDDGITRVLRGTIYKEDDFFIYIKRKDGEQRIGKQYIIRIEGENNDQ